MQFSWSSAGFVLPRGSNYQYANSRRVTLKNYQAGRAGDPPSISLAHRLKEIGLPVGRLKTGTPPRIDGRTINSTLKSKFWALNDVNHLSIECRMTDRDRILPAPSHTLHV